jgi:NAD(P)-dependent dehydrogenase (short-subunit alcohol dehydrogenase family)
LVARFRFHPFSPTQTGTTAMPVALITGASSGIGRAVTLQLAARGYTLALAARGGERLEDVGNEATAAGSPDILLKSTDMAVPASVQRLARATLDAFGVVDVLINNAGLAPLINLGDYVPNEIENIFAVNAVGPTLLVNHLLPKMLEQQNGARIVNVSSVATRDPFPGLSAYAAAKCAMNSLTQSIRNEFADRNIRAFAVAPGAVDTPMLQAIFDETQIPIANRLTPQAVADIIVQCATGDRDNESGSTIWIDSPQ